MDRQLINSLEGIGLSEKEAKVYLTMLELGEATVVDVSKKSGINRTTIYPIIEKLRTEGMVLQTKSKKHTFFVAEDPSVVLINNKKKVETFEGFVPFLQDIKGGNAKVPRVYFFDGPEGFKRIWKIIFSSKSKEYFIATDPREMLDFVKEGYITSKIIKEKVKMGIKSRQIITSSEYAKEIIAKDKDENRESRVLAHQFRLPFTVIVVDDKVALISPRQENMILLIESEGFAKTYRSMFEAVWNSLEK